MVTDSHKPARGQRAYQVKLVEFTDYVTPNIAWRDGVAGRENCFQHKPLSG